MGITKDNFTKEDAVLLKLIIDSSISFYAEKNGINPGDVSFYAKSDLASGSRIFYYYLVKNCSSIKEKQECVKTDRLNDYAQIINSVYFATLESRQKSLSKGMRLSSEYSYTLESTLVYYINFIKPYSKLNPMQTLMPDLFLKFFNQALGLLRMLNLDLASEAYSNWRTLHEAECVIKLLVNDGSKLQETYLRHLIYNNAFRQGIPSKEETDALFVEIKKNMVDHKLKSKDMKKYIEYGWLYSCSSYHEDDVNYKLNFRNGLQKAAGLEEYNQWYEMASEIAHSSPIFFYSNNDFFSDLTSVNLCDITLRAISYFEKYMEQIGIEYGERKIEKEMLFVNLKTQAEKEDDSFYTKYKDFLIDDDNGDEDENE